MKKVKNTFTEWMSNTLTKDEHDYFSFCGMKLDNRISSGFTSTLKMPTEYKWCKKIIKIKGKKYSINWQHEN